MALNISIKERQACRSFWWTKQHVVVSCFLPWKATSIAWTPRENHSGSVSIPQKNITFAKDYLAWIAQEASLVEREVGRMIVLSRLYSHI